MSPQHDDTQRPSRQRSQTTLNPFHWRKGKPDVPPTPAAGPVVSPALSLEALIEALTPPAVPSLNYARALSTTLSGRAPIPHLAILSPVLASLCSSESPVSLQAAGYDILAAYWENSGSAVLTTADRLSCLSLFLAPTIPWSQELWEPRFKALLALIQSGAETTGMESQLLKVLTTWIEGAFQGLTTSDHTSADERLERQRGLEASTQLLIAIVGKPEFVSRLSPSDTAGVLELWERLLHRALLVPPDHISYVSPPASPSYDSRAMSPQRATLHHRRHQSSTSVPHLVPAKHPADLAVDAYLTYLSKRLKALAPTHLRTILPLLFRSLAFYATPLPRISLNPHSPHQNPLERRITEMLEALVTGPYSTSCTVLMKQYFFPKSENLRVDIQTSMGAVRTLRESIRRVLINRLARSYISRMSSMAYTPSGAPTHINLERGLMERAWSKDESASWDLIRFRHVLCSAARAWIDRDVDLHPNTVGSPKEAVLNEIAAILKDLVQTYDEGGEGEEVDDEEIVAVGDILQMLVAYVRSLKNYDGGRLPISLSIADTSSPLLSAISTLLSQDLRTSPLFPVLPSAILSIAEHLVDPDTDQLLKVMNERQCLTPTSPAWLEYWGEILAMLGLFTQARPLTRQRAMKVLHSVWEFVKDIPIYRRPLAELVYTFWEQYSSADEAEDMSVIIIWRILGDEVVLRTAEIETQSDEGEPARETLQDEILSFLVEIAQQKRDDDDDTASIRTFDTQSQPPASQLPSTVSSPITPRAQSDVLVGGSRERESTIPSVMSLLSSFTSGNSSRSQSQPRQPSEQPAHVDSPPPHPPALSSLPHAVGAVVSLVAIFSQLAFTPLILSQQHVDLAVRVFRTLVELLGTAGCIRAKLACLQFLMRLRVDRDHRLFYATDHDKDGHINTLASLINRVGSASSGESRSDTDLARMRARPQERVDRSRRPSRGRGGQPRADPSRSRSRAPRIPLPPPVILRARDPIWSIPETLPFTVEDTDTPSEGLTSYDPTDPNKRLVLPFSKYLFKLIDIIQSEKEWEILSYVLVHLPTQLANKHLLCGPRSRAAVSELLTVLCSGISEGKLASQVERWPEGIIARDAHGLAYHTLTVLISYKPCFKDVQQQHHLVEVFLIGLSGQASTIKCCLNALALSAFELQPSMTRYLSRILEKLSQIMTNPVMAIDIIDFLAIVGSIPALHANFTEAEYKMVFGVALQYLHHHNHADPSLTISWTLSQHMQVMSYYVVYLWFLAIKLPDRPRHVKFITRQLLLANKSKDEVDEPAEVCFDWLARYTYASADPRPASSMLNDIVMNPAVQQPQEAATSEKTWIVGHSVVTIRTLARRGWIEVLSRRASGLTKFLCRSENVPMVPLGDVDPDLPSVVASLVIDRGVHPPGIASTRAKPRALSIEATDAAPVIHHLHETLAHLDEGANESSRPDPITGYVWSGSAPSQRRKEVAIDPSYFALQLAPYPDNIPVARGRFVTDTSKLASFTRMLDRTPVIDTHKIGIMYVAPGQQHEIEILRNSHGSPAYSRFLAGLGRLINLRGQVDVYAGGLDPDEGDGEYAYAWWDDIGQILFHTATLMPSNIDDQCTNKKRHIGNDFVRIIWNDSGMPYKFDTLATQFQFVNIVIEPHSRGAIAAFSNNLHENEYFKVIVQRAPGMTEFLPIGDFKLISAQNLPPLIRQLCLLADWFVSIFQHTQNDTTKDEMVTNWRSRLQHIKRFRAQMAPPDKPPEPAEEGVIRQESHRDFTAAY
ncbi:hypothetical protein OBBRIDRAFT_753322 [Obba rivulosa]|uniref:Rap-GAP domain-containing protein n=1 Tax=Obba rivulosa TaxID=1052685 RepID=A0A8E2AUM9_9APHY|nr:hypothetical protein OBBRIDRAFT_753322 [Obba rivulosa]